MDPSRILVVYYSRTGTTRALAEQLRSELHCDIERICDRTRRTGVLGYLRSILDALLRRPAPILPMRSAFDHYDLVIVGGPVWNGGIALPIRTFLDGHRADLRRVAFFCTYRRSGSAQAFREMTELAGKSACVTLDVRTAEAATPAVARKLRTFGAAATYEEETDRRYTTPPVLHELMPAGGG